MRSTPRRRGAWPRDRQAWQSRLPHALHSPEGEARHYSALDKDAEWNTGPVRRRSDWQGRGSLHKAGRNAAELYWLAHIRSSVLYVDGQPTPASKYAPGQPSSHPEED